MILLPILTAVLGAILGTWVSYRLRKRRRRRKALEEIEIALSQVQRYCFKLNDDVLSAEPDHFPYEDLKMTEEEAANIVERIRTTADNLERHVFEATRILRKHPSLPYKSEIIEALYSNELPTIEERAFQVGEIRGKIRDEIESYWLDKGGETLEELNEHRFNDHASMEDIFNSSSPPSPSLTETGLRGYISTARLGLGEILERQQSNS
jgi:hypothetical protein